VRHPKGQALATRRAGRAANSSLIVSIRGLNDFGSITNRWWPASPATTGIAIVLIQDMTREIC
jgi:hypothetical protein